MHLGKDFRPLCFSDWEAIPAEVEEDGVAPKQELLRSSKQMPLGVKERKLDPLRFGRWLVRVAKRLQVRGVYTHGLAAG